MAGPHERVAVLPGPHLCTMAVDERIAATRTMLQNSRPLSVLGAKARARGRSKGQNKGQSKGQGKGQGKSKGQGSEQGKGQSKGQGSE